MIIYGQGSPYIFQRPLPPTMPPTWTLVLTLNPSGFNTQGFVNVTGFISGGGVNLIPPQFATPVMPE